MPPGVAIVADTTHYLPRELVAREGITEVSLYVNWEGRTDRESELPGFQGYYDHLRTANEMPTTSQPSVGDFIAAYEPLVAEGREVFSIHLAAGISGTYESALQAKQALTEQGKGGELIEVMDSGSACGGMGLIVLAAGAAARAGGDLAAVRQRAAEAQDALQMWFAVDTLEYLRRGGRIGAASALLGAALKIKPILTLGEQITPVERVRTAGRAFERMCEYLESRAADGADAWVVQHIQDHERAEALTERGRKIFGCEPAFVSEVGPVIGTHVGPGLLGVGGVPSALLA